jgi:hypothetical protein
MPRGPKGERPADVIGDAVNVMRIATGKKQKAQLMKARMPLLLRWAKGGCGAR